MIENEIKRLIAEYKAELEEAGSEYARQSLKLSTFDKILEAVEMQEKAEKELKTTRPETDAACEAMEDAIRDAHYLDERDGYISGRAHE